MSGFQLSALVGALEDQGFSCRIGNMELDIHPVKRPYFDRWLSNREGFVRMLSGNLDFVGIEDVVRMGPFYNVYCLVENDSVIDADDNSHKLLDAGPYYELFEGRVASMGWSGGILADILSKDTVLSEEFSKSIMKEEVKKITVKASNYCCVIETRTWDAAGLARAFKVLDRIALDVRRLIKSIHLGENVGG
jgi:hypothetical protein